MDTDTESIRRESVIVSSDHRGVLQHYSEQHGATWALSLDDAWIFSSDSKVAERIAANVGGTIVRVAQLT